MKEVGKIRVIERIIKKKFTQGVLPTGFEACEKQLFHLVKKIHEVEVNEDAIEKYLPKIYDELKDLSREDIIKRFVSTEFNRFLDYYKNAPDLNAKMGSERERSSTPGITKLFINLGEMDQLDKNSMKDYIVEVSGVSQDQITNIEVKSSFSFIEVKTEAAEIITGTFKTARYNNRNVRIESRGSATGGGDGRSRDRGGRGGFGGGERRSFGGDRGGNRSGGYGGGERRSSGGGERRSFGGDRSERSSDRGGERRSSDSGKSFGERRSSGSDRERSSSRTSESTGGERKSNFSREKRPRKQL
jgi:ATP-dependent RNA helicase DeaD